MGTPEIPGAAQPREPHIKTIVAVHEGEKIEDIEFHAKILKYTRTAFERQIRESTMIQESREKNHILNSKAEYNQCSLPRLTTKMGHKETKEWLKEHEMTEREEKEIDTELKRRIFEIRKERNRIRKEVETGAAPDSQRGERWRRSTTKR